MDRILLPTVAAMKASGTPFRGLLYAGLMLTHEGPKLIEYNVRFGDPEAQVLVMRLKDDLLTLLLAAATGTLKSVSARWLPETALTVVMAAQGYPGTYRSGGEITGIADAEHSDGVKVFQAGTRRDGTRLVAAGGRVLNVTALGRDVRDAQARAYQAVAGIDWPYAYYRTDIGWRAAEREDM
jgi:phosphoribosylamine--glycine ligase